MHIRFIDKNTRDLFKAKVFGIYKSGRLMQDVFEKLMAFHIENPHVVDVSYIRYRKIKGDCALFFRTLDQSVRSEFTELCYRRGDSIRDTSLALLRYFIAHPDCISI